MKSGTLTLVSMVVLLAALPAHAGEAPSPVAFNAFTGVGYYNFHASSLGSFGLSSSEGDVGLDLGGDVGFRLGNWVSLVGYGEYDPIFSSPTTTLWSVGGGFRFNPPSLPEFQALLGAGFSSFSRNGASQNGWGLKAWFFFPVAGGFGPYLAAAYNGFDSSGIFAADLGLSLSY